MHRFSLWLVGPVALSAFAACGSDDGAAATPSNTITFTGTVRNGALSSIPIKGAEVCVFDRSDIPCGTSDATGAYTLAGLPKNEAITLTTVADQFVSERWDILTSDTNDTFDPYLFEEALLADVYNKAGIAADGTKGAIGVVLSDPATGGAGYAVSIAPASGDGPYYADGTSIAMSATETTKTGAASFINLAEGTYTVTVSGPSSCKTGRYIAGDAQNTWKVKVVSGFAVGIVAACGG